MRCWGTNGAGELGNGTHEPSSAPVEVVSLLDATQIAVGERATCALRRTGNVVCWGNNAEGILAVGSDAQYVTVPQEVVGLSDVRMVSGGGTHFCAVVGEAGIVRCWGRDDWGELGDGLPTGVSKIVVDVALTAVEEVRAGFRSSCARLQSGAVRCWGQNSDGLHGIGSLGGSTAAPNTSALLSSAAAALDLRWGFAGASLTSGGLQCWGDNPAGAIGNGQVSGKVLAPASVLW